MAGQSHQSSPNTLGRRTLAQDHRRLAELLRPGMTVLDIGCGTGAITAGIANAVGPEGRVTGIDRDPSLLALNIDQQYDMVTTARTLQWIAAPASAIANMVRAVKPGGTVVALDYTQNRWSPAWVQAELIEQTLVLRAVTGSRATRSDTPSVDGPPPP